jgi:hypothetical protein
MKKLSNKGVLLFATAMAFCALGMPSMASGSSWGVVGSDHMLDSSTFGFDSDTIGYSTTCARTQFTAVLASAASLEITSAGFTGCTWALSGTEPCTVTSTGTNLPWTATAITTSNIQIHGVNIDMFFEDHPGAGGCVLDGLSLRMTGTLRAARWTGNGAGQHAIELLGSTGFVTHSAALGNGAPITLTGTLSDTQGTLTVTN